MSEIFRKQLSYWSDSLLSRRNSLTSWEAEQLLKIRKARAECIGEHIPAALEKFAAAVGVTNIRYLPLSLRGRLVSKHNSLLIEINEQLSELHRRFVLAHEVAHVILEGHRAARIHESQLANRQDKPRSQREYQRLENLCDESAKEILLPIHVLRSIINGTRPSLALLLGLAQQTQAHYQVVASQILRAREWDCRIVLWRHINQRWVAVESVPSRPEDELLWLDIEHSADSIVARASSAQRVVCGAVTLRQSDWRRRYEAAEASPYGDNSVLLLVPLGS